jgi:hypothetical protein
MEHTNTESRVQERDGVRVLVHIQFIFPFFFLLHGTPAAIKIRTIC